MAETMIPDLVVVKVHLLPPLTEEQDVALIDQLHEAVASIKGTPGRELQIGPKDATVLLIPDRSDESLGACEVYVEIYVPHGDNRFSYSSVLRPMVQAVGLALVAFLREAAPNVPRVEVVIVRYEQRQPFPMA